MGNGTEKNGNPWTGGHTAGIFILIFAIPGVALWASANGNGRLAWFISLLLIGTFMAVVGHGTTRYWRGILVDDRNVMSLSRFQMIIWTIIVLSTLIAAASWNIAIGYVEPLRIAVPEELWLLMGISTVALVGSPLILSGKKDRSASGEEVKKTFDLLGKSGDVRDQLGADGVLVTNKDISMARWSDMMTGEETGNAAHADVTRIQMFFFTLIIAFAYLAALWNMFGALGDQGIEAFPSIDESTLALIGISNGGYLAAKAVPHSKTEDQQ